MKLNYIKTLFVAILTIFATTVNAETYSGSCGTNLNWNLNTETGLLKITGTGTMTSNPWSSYKSSIKSVEIGEGVTSIGSDAFDGCSGLTSVTIPNSVTSIGGSAFYGCSGLTGVYISDLTAWYNIEFKTNFISNPLFYAKKLYLEGSLVRKLEIPEGVTAIKDYAFVGLNTIRSVTIPNSVTSIGAAAFYQCSGLTSVTIPNSVTSIGDDAFYCSGLTSVTIPNSVTSIGAAAFSGCTGLTLVTIPNSVTSIGDDAFGFCFGLTGVYITDLAAWCNIEFSDYFANPLSYAHKLYLNNELVTDLVIPEGVTAIKSSAFYGCSGLTSVTIPNSVTSIGGSAFYGCSGLTSVTIPNSVTSIGGSAFSSCSKLTSVTIGSGVSEIGQYAFYYCKLKSIYSLAEYPPFIYTSTFDVDKTIPVYIPKGTKEDYEFEWSDFTNFIESDFTGVEENKLSASVVKAIAGNGIEVAEYYGKLRIVNLAGQVVKDLYVNGFAQIELPKGAYIIVTDNNSQKVVL